MKNRKAEAIRQALYCKGMLEHITKDIECSTQGAYCLYGYTAMQNDIVHLRRELNKLSKLLVDSEAGEQE